MNIRLQKYKANRVAGMNQYNAARAAGYSESTSRTRSHDIENSIKLDMINAFQQAGITDKYLATHAKEGLEAENHFKNPNWMARHQYFDSVCKINGSLKDKVEITGKDGSPLPTPIINIYGTRNFTDKSIHTGQSNPNLGHARIQV